MINNGLLSVHGACRPFVPLKIGSRDNSWNSDREDERMATAFCLWPKNMVVLKRSVEVQGSEVFSVERWGWDMALYSYDEVVGKFLFLFDHFAEREG